MKTPLTGKLAAEAAEIIFEKNLRQYVLQVGPHRARMECDMLDDRIFLTRTDVPKGLEGQNVEAVLTEKVLAHIEGSRCKLVPLCPQVKEYLRRNKAWQRLLAKGLYV